MARRSPAFVNVGRVGEVRGPVADAGQVVDVLNLGMRETHTPEITAAQGGAVKPVWRVSDERRGRLLRP